MLKIDRFYDARRELRKVLRHTPLIPAPRFSTNAEVYIKPENLQVTGSFKVRGAYYKIATMTDAEKSRGVIACSAGNHAQGVALGSQVNNIPARIFVPSTAPISKVEATKRYGAEVVLIDGIYDDAYAAACAEVEKTGAMFVHPFDDDDVIAGQGTIGLEILEDMSSVEAVVVPIGGGGLASGIAIAIKTLNPNCKVYGVQAAGAPSMSESYHAGSILATASVKTFADGIAVKRPGDKTYDYCSKYLDDIVTVTDDEIATAIVMLMEGQKLIAEGAGATALAAIHFNKLPQIKGKKVVALLSGGNIDVTILSRVIHRGLVTSGRYSELNIELLDRPGELTRISSVISSLGANVVRVNHTRGNVHNDVNACFLQIAMETRDFAHFNDIKDALQKAGYSVN
ncbi:MAG: threonine ammonia-lyase [Lentisphaeria bacterium]|nr:threonine ammonia-lyase [Lentisphaeria bacterium]MBR7144709.1 threonine ammonia-lyase [Lentisphaeria bacterium]